MEYRQNCNLVFQERMGKEGGGQSTMDGIRCWKVWAQGFGSGWAGIMRYGAMYWTPLIVFFIMKGGSAASEATPEQVKVSGATPQTPSLHFVVAQEMRSVRRFRCIGS